MPAQFRAQPALRIGPGDPAAEIDAEPGLGIAAVMAHADLGGGRQGCAVAEAYGLRPLQAETQPGDRGPGRCQVAALRPAGRIGCGLDDQRVGLGGQSEAVLGAIQQASAQPGRRHPELQIAADRGGVLVRPRLLRGHRELARAVAGRAPCLYLLGERKPPPGIEPRERGLDPALAVTGIVALADAARDDQPGGPVLVGPIGAHHGARDLAIEREVALAALETGRGAPSPEGGMLAGERHLDALLPGFRRDREGGAAQQFALRHAARRRGAEARVLLPSRITLRARSLLRCLATESLPGERHLDAGLVHRLHPALDRVQHLLGYRAAEAPQPCSRDRHPYRRIAVYLRLADAGYTHESVNHMTPRAEALSMRAPCAFDRMSRMVS